MGSFLLWLSELPSPCNPPFVFWDLPLLPSRAYCTCSFLLCAACDVSHLWDHSHQYFLVSPILKLKSALTRISSSFFPFLCSLFSAKLPKKSYLSSCLPFFTFCSFLDSLQLGFCLLCPPEAALVKVVCDLCVVKNNGHMPILVLRGG